MKIFLMITLFLTGFEFAIANENPETHSVSITTSATFSPDTLTIQVGDFVQFTNTSKITHTVTADPKLAKNPANVILPEGAEPFHSGKISPFQVYTHQFTVPGTYQYLCLPHEAHGMIGRIVVKE